MKERMRFVTTGLVTLAVGCAIGAGTTLVIERGAEQNAVEKLTEDNDRSQGRSSRALDVCIAAQVIQLESVDAIYSAMGDQVHAVADFGRKADEGFLDAQGLTSALDAAYSDAKAALDAAYAVQPCEK